MTTCFRSPNKAMFAAYQMRKNISTTLAVHTKVE